MTTDNSLPDVLIDWTEKGAIAYEVGDYTGTPMVRYTPAEAAEATIKSLRDALAANLEAMEAFGITGGAIPEARALLAKDAP